MDNSTQTKLHDARNSKRVIVSIEGDVESLAFNVTEGKAPRLWTELSDASLHISSGSGGLGTSFVVEKESVGGNILLTIPREQSGTPSQQTGGYVQETAEVAPQMTNMVVETEQITTFSDDKAVLPSAMPNEAVLPERGTQQQTDDMDHSIISFLRRPVVVSTVRWEYGTERGKDVFPQFNIPDSAVSMDMYRNKLDGFTSFRATAVLRIQVNAQPFQCGRLIIAAIPMPTLLSDRATYLTKHPSLLQSVNHVQMDINKQSEVVLRIPFLSPYNSYDLINGQFPWARVVCQVYSPLNSVDKSALEVVTWLSFDDIVLGTPTSAKMANPAREQSGPVDPSSNSISQARTAELPSISASAGGLIKGVGGLLGFGELGNTIGNIVHGIGSFFGFSKPNANTPGVTVLDRPTTSFATADGVDSGLSLGLYTNNLADSYPGLGGTKLRETSLRYVTSIPQWIGSFKFDTSTTARKELFYAIVTPHYNIPGTVSIRDGGNTGLTQIMTQPTVLGYVSNMFQYWTGSLVYTFRFVKTDFHSGRVEISYHPFTAEVDVNRVDYVYRTVVDLRNASEISLTVPYISTTPWKKTSTFDPLVKNEWANVGYSGTGVLYVRALTPLIVGNAIAAPCVECLVEVRAGPDFYLQSPTKSEYFPLAFEGYVPAPVAREQSGPMAVPGTVETRTTSLEGFVPASITGGTEINRPDTQMWCAGEVFGDFQELTRRFAFVEKRPLKKNDFVAFRAPYLIRAPQFVHYSGELVPIEGSTSITAKCFSFLSNPSPLSSVGAMYAFFRGGIRVKATIASPISYRGIQPMICARLISTENTFDNNTSKGSTACLSPVGFEPLGSKRIGEFLIPYYSPTLLSCHWNYWQTDYFAQTSVSVQLAVSPDDYPSGSTTMDLNIAVAGADDLEFNTFIGIPFVVHILDLSATNKQGTTTYLTWSLDGMNTNPFFPQNIPRIHGTDGNFYAQTLGDVVFAIPQTPCPPEGRFAPKVSRPRLNFYARGQPTDTVH